MGCCEGKYIIEGTENEVENSIRNAIINLEINTLSIGEFESKFQSIIKLPIHEVQDSKWFTQEAYHKLLDNVLINNKCDNITIKQQYNFILKPEYDNKKFPFYFFLQISSLLRGSFDEKVSFMEKGAKLHLNPLTAKQMRIFIFQYLELNLIKVTNFYIDSLKINNKPEAQTLISKVFNEINLKTFSTNFIKGINKIVLKTKPFLKDNNTDLDNELIKSNEFKEYFLENRILLDGLELRKSFYSKYINPGSILNMNDTNDVTISMT